MILDLGICMQTNLYNGINRTAVCGSLRYLNISHRHFQTKRDLEENLYYMN